MKKYIKWFLYFIIIVFIIVFLAFIFEGNFNKINRIVSSKIGFSEIENKDQIINSIFPLANELVVNQYPVFSQNTKPKFSILDDEEYKEKEEKKMLEIISLLEKEIDKGKNVISDNKKVIIENEELLTFQEKVYRENCLNIESDNDCINLLNVYEKNKIDIPKIKIEANNIIKSWDNYIIQVKENIELLKSNPVNSETQRAITLPDEIFFKYLGNKASVSEYLVYSIHELFHAYSDDKSKDFLPPVWEEGITEYFTLKILEKYTNVESSSYSSYPYQSRLIKLLSNIISDEEIMDIYINKDEDKLKNIIDEKFGKGNYNNILLIMNSIYYNSSYDPEKMISEESDKLFEEINSIFNKSL